jgi:3-oxoacyl-[acyl-carrier-protein] synthase-3
VRVLGIGAHAPERRLSNADLERMVETSDEWIVTRTGIHERRIIAPGEATSDLALASARVALERAGLAAADLDLIIVATATPDLVTPSTAALVQHGLGAVRAGGFDVNSACAGFVHALMTAHHLIAGGAFANVLVCGADALSTITDYQDRASCVLFGDGAGALVLGRGTGPGQLVDHVVGLDGAGSALITIAAGGSRKPASHDTVERREHYLRMQGPEVFRFAVSKVCELTRTMIARNGLALDDIGLLVPHQANGRILDAVTRTLGLDATRVMANVDRYGNTSNGSIPMALEEALRAGRVPPGSHVLLVGFGGGLSWGASLLRW